MTAIYWKTDAFRNFDPASDYTAGNWAGDTSASVAFAEPPLNTGGGSGSAGGNPMTKTPKLTTLVSFTGADGSSPSGGLIADAEGDLFGTTVLGGADNDGTVFEITKTESGYAGAPTTLVSFTAADGKFPGSTLYADAEGDLFGTTSHGGADDAGTVFEITKTQSGYAGAPTTLVSFTEADGAAPTDRLFADEAGDIFGTTNTGGPGGYGTVFEIVKTDGG